MLTKIARFFGYVKYVSVIDTYTCWVRCESDVFQQVLEVEVPEIVDGRLVVWDSLGTNDGYYVIG